MKRNLVVLLFLIFSMVMAAQTAESSSEKEMTLVSAIKRMQSVYPRITLCDIYKSFFQDYFGPGHIIESKEKAESYLMQELERTESFSVKCDPTGAQGNFVRVDVFYIKNGTIDKDVYLKALMNSVVVTDSTTIKQWLTDWDYMQQTIEKNGIKIENYDQDKVFINQRIANGIYEMNHSRLFNELYHPHYRIIRRDIWEKEIKPLIK